MLVAPGAVFHRAAESGSMQPTATLKGAGWTATLP